MLQLSLRLARRYLLFVIPICALSVAIACLTASLLPVRYTAQGFLIAGASSVGAAAVPGSTQAGQALAQTYSRVFTSDAVARRMAAEGFASQNYAIAASPVPASSVILVEGSADSPAKARALTNSGLKSLVSVVTALLNNDKTVDRAKSSVQEAGRALATARAALARAQRSDSQGAILSANADIQTATAELQAATSVLSQQLQSSQQANSVQLLTSARVNGSTSGRRFQLAVPVGLLGGVVLSTLTVAGLERTRSRKASS